MRRRTHCVWRHRVVKTQLEVRRLQYALLLISMLTLTACASEVQRPVAVQRADPPVRSSDCPREPVMPIAWISRQDKVLWISRDKDAGDKCRSAFDILLEWVLNPPKEK